MEPIAPILLDIFSSRSDHEFPILYEPLLCYTIMTIASCGYSRPFPSSSPSHELIHAKCWEITKTPCQRVFCDQEVGSNSKLRTFGTALALLLLTEWPPRMISLPPDEMADYVPDSAETSFSAPTHGGSTLEDKEHYIRLANGNWSTIRLAQLQQPDSYSVASRWMAELSQPIIRSDRISGYVSLIPLFSRLYSKSGIVSCAKYVQHVAGYGGGAGSRAEYHQTP